MDDEAFNLEVALLAFGNQSRCDIYRAPSTTPTERGWLDVAS